MLSGALPGMLAKVLFYRMRYYHGLGDYLPRATDILTDGLLTVALVPGPFLFTSLWAAVSTLKEMETSCLHVALFAWVSGRRGTAFSPQLIPLVTQSLRRKP